jgi:hypothetical protein
MSDPKELLEHCKDVLSMPPEVAEAYARLERKRVLRENTDALIEHADDLRKRHLETIRLTERGE